MRISFAKINKRLTMYWRSGAIGATGAVLLGLFFFESRVDIGLRRQSFDCAIKWHPQTEITEAAIVFMDDASRINLGHQPLEKEWDRAYHARLLTELKARGATAVVMDVLFDDPMSSAEKSNQALAAAIKDHGRVVLAASLPHPQSKEKQEIEPPLRPSAVLGTNLNWGIIELPKDEEDDVVRQHCYAGIFPGMAWKVAELFGRQRGSPTDQRWINFYGPSGTIPHYRFEQVLQPDTLPWNTFSNKVVFVGRDVTITPEGKSDLIKTLYGSMAGVEVQATACLNFLRGDSYTELLRGLQRLLFMISGIVFGYGLAILRPWIAAAAAAVALVAVGTLSLLFIWKAHCWFPWLILCQVQIPAALGWSFLANTKRVYREKDVLEEELSKVKSGVPGTSPASSPASSADVATAVDAPAGGIQFQTSDLNTVAVAPDGSPVIPDHDMVRCIGKGAYGEVWLAKDIIGSFHAVKVVYRKTFSSDGPFEREFRGIQKFTPISRSHPGFVNILHVGRNNQAGYFYYIMELGDDEVRGQQIDPADYKAKNLAREIERRGKFTADECLHLALALTAALDCLHQQQLIHRDIKPSNIIFVNGTPKIADIGLVTKIAETGSDSTYIGTEGYIPPEGPGTTAADVYSLGKVIYEASMGRHIGHFPELPTTLIERSDYKELLQLNEVILKACETNREVRYKSAGEMHADLVRLRDRLNAQHQKK